MKFLVKTHNFGALNIWMVNGTVAHNFNLFPLFGIPKQTPTKKKEQRIHAKSLLLFLLLSKSCINQILCSLIPSINNRFSISSCNHFNSNWPESKYYRREGVWEREQVSHLTTWNMLVAFYTYMLFFASSPKFSHNKHLKYLMVEFPFGFRALCAHALYGRLWQYLFIKKIDREKYWCLHALKRTILWNARR